MMFRLFMVFLLAFCLVACSSASAESTQSPQISRTQAQVQSPEPLPSDTPVATPTALPERLEMQPENYNLSDVVVVADSFAFQVTRTYTIAQLNDWTPANDKTYLIMEGIVYNYSDTLQEFFRTNFEIEDANGEKYLPNLDLMEALRTSEYTDLDYAGRRNGLVKAFPVDAYSWRRTFLAYEINTPVDMARLHFTPLDRPIPSTIEIWYLSGETEGELRAYEAYDNNVQQYEIDFDFDNQQTVVEDIIDEQTITVDNCFGTDVIDRTRTFTESTEVSYSFGMGIGAGVGLGVGSILGNSILGDILALNFTMNYEVSSGESLTETIEETLRAAPSSVTNYRLTWYRVTVQGLMRLRLGGENFYIPYSLTNRLRADLVSLPAGDCAEATQDN